MRERREEGSAEDEQGHWDLTRACSANVSDMRVDDIWLGSFGSLAVGNILNIFCDIVGPGAKEKEETRVRERKR